MTTEQLLRSRDFEKSLLIGYYGGGNYGDELLLEVLSNKLHSLGVRDVTITYQNPKIFNKFHHDFGYKIIPMHNRKQLGNAVLKNKKIVIGGGGLWGLDVNSNIFVLSLMLYLFRWILKKKIYLLGVGFYGSTNRIGKISAWLAGKSATIITARDAETYRNFTKFSKNVYLDTDLAWMIPSLNLNVYRDNIKNLDASMPIRSKTIFITLRRFKASQKNNYLTEVNKFLAKNKKADVIVSLMEPKEIDTKGFDRLLSWEHKYENVRITDFSYNPLALYLFFQNHKGKLAFIGPQFHMIITAYLNHVNFLPISYDNKVSELFRQIGQKKFIAINDIRQSDLKSFVQEFGG